MDEMSKIRESLQEARNALLRREKKVVSNLRRERTPLSRDSSDAATVLQNDEVLDALDQDGRARLEGIDAALGRLEDGTYGDCGLCGDPIAPARLAAIPEAALCVDCAQAGE